MSFNTLKLKWARKLLKAKMFIVMTEKESAIAVDGADPYTFTDAMALAAQSAELEMFQQSLNQLVKDHQDALKNLSGVSNEAKTKKSATSNRKADAVKSAEKTRHPRQLKASVRSDKTKETKAKKS